MKAGLSDKQAVKPDSEPIFEPYLKEIKRLQRENKGLRGQIGLLRKGKTDTQVESTPSEAKKEEINPHEAPDKHFIKPYDKVCTTCGEKNDQFKDETMCDGCGKHLGAKEFLPKIKACPDCGSTKAHLLTGVPV